MNDLLSHLDSSEASDASAVPSLCLQIAAYLSERGDKEAEGWRALGRLRRIPDATPDATQWTWRIGLVRYDHGWSYIPRPWSRHVPWMYQSRSAALRAAAVAFVGLPDEVKREIMGTQLETIR